MKDLILKLSHYLFWAFLAMVTPHIATAAESGAPLAARETGVPVFARQDDQTDRIGSLEKGEALFPLAQAVGQEIWYMVRTKAGMTGWVRASDVVVSSQTKDSFKEKDTTASSWAAINSDGRAFNGNWSVAAPSAARSANGRWTLSDGSGLTIARGTWTAEMHSTGWNGTWRAATDGRQNEFRGSWSLETPNPHAARFAELFETAAKDALRGIWTGGKESGTWSVRVAK